MHLLELLIESKNCFTFTTNSLTQFVRLCVREVSQGLLGKFILETSVISR